jgi:hypothetical protein
VHGELVMTTGAVVNRTLDYFVYNKNIITSAERSKYHVYKIGIHPFDESWLEISCILGSDHPGLGSALTFSLFFT